MADLASASQDIPLADEGDDGCPTISDYAAQRVRPAEPLPRPADEEDEEEKARLIANVLELQNTLDDLSQRVDSVKEESIKLRQENQVLGQYIHNLMAASSIFQSATPKSTNNNEMLSSYFW